MLSYLHDRPRYTIMQCLKRNEGEKLPRCNVTCVDLNAGKFHVKGSGEQYAMFHLDHLRRQVCYKSNIGN